MGTRLLLGKMTQEGEESRWKNRRMWMSYLKNIKNPSTKETVPREHMLMINGRLQTSKRTSRIPSQLGRMKEKKKRGNKQVTRNHGGKLRARRGSCT